MTLFQKINTAFASSNFTISDFVAETESKKYDACNFKLNALKIYFRKAKLTPKKEGQFVTFWKRTPNSVIAPFDQLDDFHFLIVEVESALESGYFIFPKEALVTKNIISSTANEGKRAFRIYPPWTLAKNKQAVASQKGQIQYFINKNNLILFFTKK